MSMNKGIKYGKEHRREYRGAKAIDVTCRNHGNCSYCRENRLFARRRVEEHSRNDLRNWSYGE